MLYFRPLLSILCIIVQLLSHVWLFATWWTAARQASLFFTVSLSLLKLTCIESVMPSSHLILCCPLLLLPSIQKYSLGTHCFCPGLSAGGARSPGPVAYAVTPGLRAVHVWMKMEAWMQKEAERTGRGLPLCPENAVDLLSGAPITPSIRWWWLGPLWWSSS